MALAVGYGIVRATPLTLVLRPCLLAAQEGGINTSRRLVGAIAYMRRGRPSGCLESTENSCAP